MDNEEKNVIDETLPEAADIYNKPRLPKKALLRIGGLAALLILLIAAIALVLAHISKNNGKSESRPSSVYTVNADSVESLSPYASGVVVLTANSLEYVDQYGNLMQKNDQPYTSPVVVTGGKDLILFDRGGRSLRIEKNGTKYLQLDLDAAVTCADITDNGTYAYVLNADSGYQSHLFAYSYKGKLLFEWSSADYIIDVSLSPSGKAAAVISTSVVNAETVFKVVYFNFSKSEPIVTEFPDATVYNVEFTANKKLAVETTTGTYLLNAKGEVTELCAFTANELSHTAMCKNGMGAVAVDVYGNTNNELVRVFGRGMKHTFEHSYTEPVLDVKAAPGYVAVLHQNSIEIINEKDRVTGNIVLNGNCLRSVISGGRIYVLTANGLLSYSLHEMDGEEK